MLGSTAPEAIRAEVRAFGAHDLRLDLGRLSVPGHLVVGSDDPNVSVEAAQELCGRVAGAQLTVVEGAGHALHLEEVERIAVVVRGMLEQG